MNFIRSTCIGVIVGILLSIAGLSMLTMKGFIIGVVLIIAISALLSTLDKE